MVDDFLDKSVLTIRFNIVKKTVIPYHGYVISGHQHTAFCKNIHLKFDDCPL
jgi:hypothetical protein